MSSLHALAGRVARLKVAAGIEPSKDEMEHLLAEEIAPDTYRLGGRWLSGEELRAEMEKQAEAEHADRELRGELGLDKPVQGDDLHTAAVALLNSRQIWKPTAEQLLEVYQELGAA